jgi:hypothetical protein
LVAQSEFVGLALRGLAAIQRNCIGIPVYQYYATVLDNSLILPEKGNDHVFALEKEKEIKVKKKTTTTKKHTQ